MVAVRSALALAAAALVGTSPALADDGPPPVPLRLADRPLTLPAGVLRGNLGGSYLNLGPASAAFVALSGGYGITGDLQVGATLLPVEVSPRLQYGSPALSATYRFVTTPSLEIGAGLGAAWSAPATATYPAVSLAPSVPILVHTGGLRVDSGVVVPVRVGGPPAQVGLLVPASVSYQLQSPEYVGVTTGLGVESFAFFSSAYVPAGLFVGDAFRIGCHALLDVRAAVAFPQLVTPALHGGLVTSDYEVDLTATVYLGRAGPCTGSAASK